MAAPSENWREVVSQGENQLHSQFSGKQDQSRKWEADSQEKEAVASTNYSK